MSAVPVFHTSYQRTNSFYKCTLFLRSLFWCPSLCLPISKEQRHLALFISLVIKINTLYIIIRIRVFIFILSLSLSTDLYRLEWISLISFFLIIYIKLVKISTLSITSLKEEQLSIFVHFWRSIQRMVDQIHTIWK